MLCYVLSRMGGYKQMLPSFQGLSNTECSETVFWSGNNMQLIHGRDQTLFVLLVHVSGFFLMLTFGGGVRFSTEIRIELLM